MLDIDGQEEHGGLVTRVRFWRPSETIWSKMDSPGAGTILGKARMLPSLNSAASGFIIRRDRRQMELIGGH